MGDNGYRCKYLWLKEMPSQMGLNRRF